MKRLGTLILTGLIMIAFANGNEAADEPNRLLVMTVMYDNYVYGEDCSAEWGFSCLVEGLEQTLLFDTGGKPEILAANFKALGKDPNDVDIVVISHMHWDHINGLEWLTEENPNLKLFLPQSAAEEQVAEFKDKAHRVERVSEMQSICKSAFCTGTLSGTIPEQALRLESAGGLVVITGCSHPGIVRILKTAKAESKEPLYHVFGGFHLKNHSREDIQKIIEEMKLLGVKKVGPTHCTGDAAIAQFQEAWGEDFIRMGAGSRIHLKRAEK